MELFAGLDIGTNGVRLVVADEQLKLKYQADRYYATRSPKTGWAEQDAREILSACQELLEELADKFKEEEIYITFCSVMHSIMGVDQAGNPLTPLIIWADTRSREKRRFLEENYGKEMFYQKTGCPLHSTYWPAKIMWLKEAYAKQDISRFVSIKEYIVYQLCGKWLTDYSLVSTSGLFNHQQKGYDQELLEIIGISPENLSRIVPTGERLQFRINDKKMTGLMGATDGVLANLGTGAIDRNKIVISVGSSAAVRYTSREFNLDPAGRAWCYILDNDYYVIGEATNGAGVILKWLADLFKYDSVSELLKDNFEGIPYSEHELLFIPTMMGERGPSYNEDIRGMFYGLSLNHSRKEIVTAIYEGIALYTRMVYQDVERVNGHKPEAILMTGGLGLSEDFMKLANYLFGDVFYLPGHDQNTAVGAVLMGIKEIKERRYEEIITYLPQAETRSYIVDNNFQNYLGRKYQRFISSYQEISNKAN